MSRLRKAVMFASAEQYVGLGTNFVIAVVTSRLMAPNEIGIAVVGAAIVAMATALREYATPNYLIRNPDVSPESMRGPLTGIIVANIALVVGLALAAPLLGLLYADGRLASYLKIVALGLLAEAFASPVVAVLRREMEFDKAAAIGMTCTAATAAVTIGMAAAGFGSLSFAWGVFFGTSASALTAAVIRPGFWLFRPTLTSWRALFAFGGYNGTNSLLRQLCDSIPYLVLGQVLSPEVVAYYHRGLMLSQLPGKLVLGGVEAMMLPHLSAQARRNQSLKIPFLYAVECTTALYWPALIAVAILAEPIVLMLYGPSWLAAAPLLKVIALATLFLFIGKLDIAVFIATGGLPVLLKRSIIVFPACAAISTCGALFGVMPLALSNWLTYPIQLAFSLYFTKRQISFSWSELASPLSRSALVSILSAVGPLVVVAIFWPHIPTTAGTCLACALALTGWLLALWLTRHSLFLELKPVRKDQYDLPPLDASD
jgi:O-antigen/teichoic acid export membrane protein